MNVLRTIPKQVIIAYSGGIDSSVLLHLALKNKNRKVILAVFDHETETSKQEVNFADYISKKYSLDLMVGYPSASMIPGDSRERYWSQCRNNWFNTFTSPVATGHNLDDALEWYLMTALIGNGGYYMDYSNRNIIRPILTSSKQEIILYAQKYNIEYISDPTNNDLDFNQRNKVRHSLVPEVLKINPGIYSTIKRNIIRKML